MTQSEELFARAQRLMPGGVNSPVRAFKAVGGTPLFVRKAEAARLWDADGRGYVDYVGSWGPLVLGHAHPAVLEAIAQAAARGTSYRAPCLAQCGLATRAGALLVFDEVITGFRLSTGGAQVLYGVKPDLTCLGKIIGGGLPVGAYGGRADVMEQVAPTGPVYQAGTLSGNPLAMAAGLATLRALDDGLYRQLERKTARLVDGLAAAAGAAGVPATA